MTRRKKTAPTLTLSQMTEEWNRLAPEALNLGLRVKRTRRRLRTGRRASGGSRGCLRR